MKDKKPTTIRAKAAPVRKKRDREATTQKLLQAGVEVFSKLGFDGATTKIVAKKAGVAEALIIRYFGSKDGLLAAILEKYIESVDKAPFASTPPQNLKEEITQYLLAKMKRDLEVRDFLKVAVTHAFVDKKFAEKIREFAHKGGSPLLKDRLKALQHKGGIPKCACIETIARDVQFYSFSTYFCGELLLKMCTEEVETAQRRFAETYSLGVTTKMK
jgi:AcrR family transcriptional regulator